MRSAYPGQSSRSRVRILTIRELILNRTFGFFVSAALGVRAKLVD
jgi:hypothetical protein